MKMSVKRSNLFWLVVSACVAPSLLAQQVSLPPFRVLVQARASEGANVVASAVARSLSEIVREDGYQVVDEEQARSLAQRERALLAQWSAPLEGLDGGESLLLSRCDVLVRVDVEPVRQRKQQGRYIVDYSCRYKVSFVDSAEALGSGEGRGRGRTLEGYDEADRQARDELVDVAKAGSLAAELLGELKSVRDDEQANGARLTVAFYVDDRSISLIAPLSRAVSEADGVVAGTFSPLRTFPSPAAGGNTGGACSEVGIRYRGTTTHLQEAVLRKLGEISGVIEKEHGVDVRATVVASGRRLDVIITTSPSATALASEVEKVIGEAVETVYRRNCGVLAGKRLAVLPAAMVVTAGPGARLAAFRRAFRDVYDAVEQRLKDDAGADPLTQSGSVKVLDVAYESLAAAKQQLMLLEEEFRASKAGSLAGLIGELVEGAFENASDGAVTTQPMSQDRERAIDLIRMEAAASAGDGAVKPGSIAFYEQEGSEFVVATNMRRLLDQYTVTVNVMDLASGVSMQCSARFHQRFTDQLEEQLGK